MTTSDKAKNSTLKTKGTVKETVGKATGNDRLRKEGKVDQIQADLKQAGEHIKDALNE
jgi:uncharacterized protein YjbJ (UPF0337 family)